MAFKKRNTITDQRAIFANDVCDLLFGLYKSKLYNTALPEVKKFYNHFEDNIRNFYEVIDDEVPLFRLFELISHGAENYGLTNAEWEIEKLNAIKACEEYYN